MYLWDIRYATSPVLELRGQVNSHSRLNFCVDDDQSVVIAGGQDRHIRAWSLRTGALLMQRPPVESNGGDPNVVRFMSTEQSAQRFDDMHGIEESSVRWARTGGGMIWANQGRNLEVWGTV